MDTALAYRKDIDGLRAIAVTAVIIFHTEIFGLTGGFIGVDVFFVISGYLISQRVIASKIQGKFSFLNFYTRRIKRLFPALFSTCLLTLIAGCLLLSPSKLQELATSAASSITSVANIHFFIKAGYWDASSWEKPLLHMWSLGVEEQFYLFWPLLLVFIINISRTSIFLTLLAITIGSFIITSWLSNWNNTAAFYLTPFRIYEFAFGALCVRFDHFNWRQTQLHKIIQPVLSLFGLVMILTSALYFDENTPFPSYWAAIPALGTALMIVAGESPLSKHLLSNPIARYIGLISYSLYLIHWPVLVFVKGEVGELDYSIVLISMAAIFILSILQYHLVETPFRNFTWKNESSLSKPE